MHFSLVKMNPEDAPPSHGFDDAILPLFYALGSLGFKVELLFNRFNARSRNIIFGSCIAPRRIGRILPPGSIIFNLEQMNAESKWCNSNYLSHLRDYAVWDYSSSNVAFLAGAGIKALHVPLGYVPEMSRLREDYPTDVDLLFYGLITDRRKEIISRMHGSGIRVLATQEAFGNLRDKLLAHSALVLNVHQFLPARLEVVRLGYVFANKKAVLSERRADTEIPEHLLEACAWADYADLPEKALSLLCAPARLSAQAQAGFRAFAARPMAAALEKLVGRKTFPAPEPALRHGPPAEQSFYAGARPEWLITGHTNSG